MWRTGKPQESLKSFPFSRETHAAKVGRLLRAKESSLPTLPAPLSGHFDSDITSQCGSLWIFIYFELFLVNDRLFLPPDISRNLASDRAVTGTGTAQRKGCRVRKDMLV